LKGSDKPEFLQALGLVAEPPMSFSVQGFERLLRANGPLWITTDEDPSEDFSVHARVLVGLRAMVLRKTPRRSSLTPIQTQPQIMKQLPSCKTR
jgi:hypothetical protein